MPKNIRSNSNTTNNKSQKSCIDFVETAFRVCYRLKANYGRYNSNCCTYSVDKFIANSRIHYLNIFKK